MEPAAEPDEAESSEIEWSETALDDMAALDEGNARRVKASVERFASTGAGNVSRRR